MTGFRLSRRSNQKSTISTSTVLTPEYTCLQHAFGFRARARVRVVRGNRPPGHRAVAGSNDRCWCPDRSQARRRLFTRGPRAPCLRLTGHDRGPRLARSRGADGQTGVAGTDGRAGWSRRRRGSGVAGGNGSGGGPGRARRASTIIAPAEEPFPPPGSSRHKSPVRRRRWRRRCKGGAGGKGRRGAPAKRSTLRRPGLAGAAGPPGCKGSGWADGRAGDPPAESSPYRRRCVGQRIPPSLAELIQLPHAPPVVVARQTRQE